MLTHVDRRYEDDTIVVVRREGRRSRGEERPSGFTAHFTVGRVGPKLLLVHDLDPAALDNDVTGLLADELFAPGWAVGPGTFERLFTGIVLTSGEDSSASWELFYRNSLRRIAQAGPGRPGALADFAPVYLRAEALLAEVDAVSMLDLGSCFGFFPLRVAAQGRATVVATDLCASTCRLLDSMAARLGVSPRLSTVACDAARVPLADGAADVVCALHLLEHVDAGHGRTILEEATRLARHRVVAAVPLEAEPDPTFGHVRVITLADLSAEAERLAPSGWRGRVEEFHGGWLVLDRVDRGC